MTDGPDQLLAHYADVYRFVRRRSASEHDAEDITQAVFVAAVLRLDELVADSRPLLAWLYTVARRRLIDHARRRSRMPVSVPLEEQIAGTARTGYGSDVRVALARALEALPDAQRDIVIDRLVRDHRFADIAQQRGISEAAAQMRFVRALARLRTALEQEGVNP